MTEPASLEAKDPFELRVDQAEGVSEEEVREALASGDLGFLHSFTTGSAVDGPGMRVVAWTTGCMFRCLYCHNPDTWKMKNGVPVTVERAAQEIRRYRQGLRVMSGGFTLSGGEPLVQDRFAVKLLTTVHGQGIHTALDTNGFFGERLSDAELEQIDVVLLDIKGWDRERYLRLTAQEIEPTLAFARRLAARGRTVWLRFVLVPGLTDDPGDIANIARFCAELGNVARVDVLPFHQMGRYKWEKLGLTYELGDVKPPTVEIVERALALFRAEGLKAC
jgi:pyruvate formate lyase activating enzyme